MNEIETRIESMGFAKLIGHFENGSPEWLEARSGIGGSDIGTICGVNPYKSREDLLQERLSDSTTVLVPNLPMRLGTALEPSIRRLWAEDNEAFLSVVETGTWQSTENPFWKANVDGIIVYKDGRLGILEIKFSQAPKLSDSWLYQVNWYLMLLGLESAILVQLRGNKFAEYEIKADAELQETMKLAARLFEEEVTNGIQSK
jgi:putative phage-type endonuclease